MTVAATGLTTSNVIVREIDIRAPMAKVFAALTEPDKVTAWWGSTDSYVCDSMEVDFRVGGTWKTVGHSLDGRAFTVYGVYRVIEPPRVVEFTWRHDWGARGDEETVVRYELSERDGMTHLRVVHSGFGDEKGRSDHEDGWLRVLGWLQNYVE